MKDKNHQWRLMAKKIAGEASAEECKQLQVILNDNPVLVTIMNTLTDFSNAASNPDDISVNNQLEMHFQRMKNQQEDYMRSKQEENEVK